MKNTNVKKVKERGNGEGTIYENKKTGLLVAQYFVDGERKSLYQRKKETKTDFKKRFIQVKNSINEGTYIDKSNETVVTLAREYIETKFNDRVTSERTYGRDLETLKQLENTCSNFCNLPIQKVTLKHLQNAKKDISEYSNSVIDKIWRLLNKSFKKACSPSRKILTYNLMEDDELKKPISKKTTKIVKSLSDDELEKLNHILDNEEKDHKYRNIVKMQLISGMRIGEVLARSFNDLNNETNELYVHNTLTQDKNYRVIWSNHTKNFNIKTNIDEGRRYLPLDNSLFNELLEIINNEFIKYKSNPRNLIFWDYENNTFIKPNQVASWLVRLNKKYNICKESLSTHRLRHTAITHWKELGIDLSVIQYLAGHVEGSDITEKVYIDTRPEFVKQELEKFS